MTGKKTILVVDDSEINRKILCKILEGEYHTLEAGDGVEALAVLDKKYEKIALILLDLHMPNMDGFEFMEKKHESERLAGIPVIVTTQQEGEETEEKALSLGACDFLVKPYKPAIIKHRIANGIKMRENAAVIHMVEKDALTGVYSKELFYQKATEILKNNLDRQYDIVCADLEHFKLINDLFGTREGDRLLKYLAGLIENYVGKRGICGRIGADTFIVLMNHQDEYPNEGMEDILVKLDQYPLNINLILRFGIYVIDDVSTAINVMCDWAKLAIDSIKGKYDVYCSYYDASVRDKLLEEQMIVDNMKPALKDGQFQVYYQPKYELATESISGAEALVRWIHPQKGFMSPASFIPLFEKNGFITELDIYVWETACKEIRRCLDEGLAIPSISVNVSRTDIYNPNFITILTDLIHKYNLEPSQLHLEITETAYTENPKQIIEVVTNLKKVGFIIEMDDFGTGYSSLNALSELPIDILKLDMSFIRNASQKANNRNILSFIISLAKWLGLSVVSEGVETEEQIIMLRGMDCDYVQGYYYAKPLPVQEFEALLRENEKAVREQKRQISETVGEKQQKQERKTGRSEANREYCMMIVDDSEIVRASLVAIFEDDYKIIEVENGLQAMELLEKTDTEVDIIMLDLVMPLLDGFQVLKRLKSNERLKEIPVIVTSQAEEDSESRALLLGAADFVAKPYNQEVAKRRVENVIADARLKQFEKQEKQLLRRRAQQDPLTGLLNRIEIEERIDNYLEKEPKGNAVLFMIDMDCFKYLNDTRGHDKGDEILVKFAKMLKEYFAGEPVWIGRMGGDEFSVFLKRQVEMEELEKILSRLCAKVSSCMKDGYEMLSASVGVCSFPQDGSDFKSLYANADKAMLNAKIYGKNKYKVYSRDMEFPSLTLSRNVDWLLDEMYDSLFVCDANTYDMLYANEVACKLAGKEKHECNHKKCYEFMWNRTEPCKHCLALDRMSKEYLEEEFGPEGGEHNYMVKAKLIEWDGRLARIQYVQDRGRG